MEKIEYCKAINLWVERHDGELACSCDYILARLCTEGEPGNWCECECHPRSVKYEVRTDCRDCMAQFEIQKSRLSELKQELTDMQNELQLIVGK